MFLNLPWNLRVLSPTARRSRGNTLSEVRLKKVTLISNHQKHRSLSEVLAGWLSNLLLKRFQTNPLKSPNLGWLACSYSLSNKPVFSNGKKAKITIVLISGIDEIPHSHSYLSLYLSCPTNVVCVCEGLFSLSVLWHCFNKRVWDCKPTWQQIITQCLGASPG